MRRHPVGRTSVALTELGFGGTGLGNLYEPVSDADARAAVDAAYASGVRYFDTAPSYGNGLSESRLGAALADLSRDDVVVSTKVGYALDDNVSGESYKSIFKDAHQHRPRTDFTADAIKRSLEQSLARLGMDRIDIVWMHDPDEAATIFSADASRTVSHFDTAMTEAYPILADLRAQGVIGAIGVGMNQWEMLEDFMDAGEFDCFLLAGRYTLLEQGALVSFLPRCVDHGVSVVIGGPFNSGVLATGSTEGARHNYMRLREPTLSRVRALEEACGRHGVTLPAAALQFPLAHQAVVSVVPGARSGAEAEANAMHMRHPIPRALWDELAERELIAPGAPAPADGPLPLGR